MSRLTRKFMAGVTVILTVVALLSLYLNQNFIGRYVLYQEKKDLNRICDRLAAGEGTAWERAARLEKEEDVVIAVAEGSGDNEVLNERLREAFLEKGVSLKKYWLWDQDQQDAMETGRKMRLYSQEKLHYSVLVEYVSLGEEFFAAAKIIPSMERTLNLVNQVTLAVFLGAVITMLVLIFILVRKITAPLFAIGRTAKAISDLDFQVVEVHTGDELEDLAKDINHMSMRLKEAHERQEDLLSNVTHDLKTPVALIKAYGNGMRDGIDDGTFLDTILAQNERMEKMTERLLVLSKMKQKAVCRSPVDISKRLRDTIEQYRLLEVSGAAAFACEIEESVEVTADPESVDVILSNLISNAVKYCAFGAVVVVLRREENVGLLTVSNHVAEESRIDVQKLWEPFYVAEESRNKGMSGTGLGLALVKAAARRCGFGCDCRVEEGVITFSIRLS